MAKKKVFYGWYLCVASILMLVGGTGIVNNSASQFLKPVSSALGISRGQFSLYLSFMTIALMILCPFIGKVYSKWNPRVVTVCGGILMAAGWTGLSVAKNVTQLYILGFVIGLGLTFVSLVTVNIIMNNWFYEKKGMAMGLAMTGSGIGSMIFNPLASKLILSFGYQTAYRWLGLISIACMIPFFILYHYRPSEIGLAPLGIKNPGTLGKQGDIDLAGVRYQDAIRMPKFWAVCFISFGLSASTMGLYTQAMPYLTDIGYERMTAAGFISMMGLCLAFGKAVFGWTNDKLGARMNFSIILIISIAGVSLLYFAKNPAAAYLASILFGLSIAAPFVVAPLITIYAFGSKDFVNIYGTVTTFLFLGPAIAPPLSGWIYDVKGNYDSAFVLYVILLSLVFIVGQVTLNKKNEVAQEKSA